MLNEKTKNSETEKGGQKKFLSKDINVRTTWKITDVKNFFGKKTDRTSTLHSKMTSLATACIATIRKLVNSNSETIYGFLFCGLGLVETWGMATCCWLAERLTHSSWRRKVGKEKKMFCFFIRLAVSLRVALAVSVLEKMHQYERLANNLDTFGCSMGFVFIFTWVKWRAIAIF